MKSTRVFVTGMGLLSASGLTVEENWRSLLNEETHLAPIEAWDLTGFPVQLGGELKNFQPAEHLPDRKLLKALSYQDVIGLAAARQAIEQSQLTEARDASPDPEKFNDMTGIYVGSPGNKYLQQYDFLPLLAKSKGDMHLFANELFNEIHPMWLLRILPNNVLAYTGILYGFKGPNHNVTNHAVGGVQALLEAYHAIQAQQIERAVVVAYDLGIDPQALFYYDKLGLLSHDAPRPFDKHHSGTVLANGAAALVIESEASLQTRNAPPYVEILGGQVNTEGMGLFGIENEAKALTNLLFSLMQTQQIQTDDLAFLVAHGNGAKASDETESLALQRLFENTPLPITAFKWSMGHTLVASGLLDTILATQALNQKRLPGIATLQTKHPLLEKLNITSQAHTLHQGNTAFIINRGFASMNACLAIKACEPH